MTEAFERVIPAKEQFSKVEVSSDLTAHSPDVWIEVTVPYTFEGESACASLTPGQARAVAVALIEAAEAAEKVLAGGDSTLL